MSLTVYKSICRYVLKIVVHHVLHTTYVNAYADDFPIFLLLLRWSNVNGNERIERNAREIHLPCGVHCAISFSCSVCGFSMLDRWLFIFEVSVYSKRCHVLCKIEYSKRCVIGNIEMKIKKKLKMKNPKQRLDVGVERTRTAECNKFDFYGNGLKPPFRYEYPILYRSGVGRVRIPENIDGFCMR